MARQPYADARLWTADRGPVAHLPTPLLYGLVHPEPLTMLHSNNFRVDHMWVWLASRSQEWTNDYRLELTEAAIWT